MTEWWTYRLEDFQMYSAETWFRLLEAHNGWLWPWQVPMLAFGGWLAWTAWRGEARGVRFALIGLAALWLFVAWAFLERRLAPIDLAGPWYAWGFALQGFALYAWALRRSEAVPPPNLRLVGAAFVDFAVTLLPLLAPMLAYATGEAPRWHAVAVFGATPDATAVATLGLCIALAAPWPLLVLPLAWLAVSGAMQWNLGIEHALVLPIAGACAVAVRAVQPRATVRM